MRGKPQATTAEAMLTMIIASSQSRSLSRPIDGVACGEARICSVSSVQVTWCEGILEAREGPGLLGSQQLTLYPGGPGWIYSPEFVSIERTEEVLACLLASAIELARQAGCWRLQWVCDAAAQAPREGFRRGGFSWLTSAALLTCETIAVPGDVPLHAGLELVDRGSVDDRELLIPLLAEIDAASLDCPELKALRTPQQAFDAHRQVCDGREPFAWTLERQGRIVGAALAAPTDAAQGPWDLLTFGIVPAARGGGLGIALLQAVGARAARLGATQINTSVDVRNIYAAKCYKECGYSETSVAEVWVHSLGRAR